MSIRNLLVILSSVTITAGAVFIFVFLNMGSDTGGLPENLNFPRRDNSSILDNALEAAEGVLGLVGEDAGSASISERKEYQNPDDNIQKYMADADKYISEALPLKLDKERYALIDKISKYNNSFTSALDELSKIGSGELLQEYERDLIYLARKTSEHIFIWTPFFYKIHPEAQSVLLPVINSLEGAHKEMVSNLADIKPGEAGAIAAEDFEYYIEDIRKSAARRNSDFIKFSYDDYLKYRTFFDEKINSYDDFYRGFASGAHIFFDDLYAMREEVDADYSDKTRKYIADMHAEILEIHRRGIFLLADKDKKAAIEAASDVILEIKRVQDSHANWRKELFDIMEYDYAFYENIKKELDK